MKRRAKFYVAFSKDARTMNSARVTRSGMKPIGAKPGEAVVCFQVDLDDRVFETLLQSPPIEVKGDDVQAPKLVVVKEG